jgi:hypothetical protein
MEEAIEKLVALIKSKKKVKELTIFVPTVKFANLFVENAEKELELLNITNFDPVVELSIFVEKGTDEEDEKDKDKT